MTTGRDGINEAPLLIAENGLKQADLAHIVAQPNLSAILNGNRAISRSVARKLAERFNVAVDVFL